MAVEDVKNQQLNQEIDGLVLGRWLLTEISSWNRDKERLVILCENNIIICKYDYVAMKLASIQRIALKQLKEVHNGNFDYPPNSVSVPRLYKGVRITWGTMDNQPWYQKWNPLNTDIPFSTFTSHPVLALPDLETKEAYDVQSFLSGLKQALEKVPNIKYIDNQPIIIESYAGFASYVHNQSRLGFSRERGGVSF
uniref:tumor protein p63-regulated gene 1-like protein n=1 Tax=Styela clava TaxID=7725 RepID=UPI00193AD6C7|nr:tumor protein p63-regulated gene 1-like protein [Styela clava]